MSKDLQEYAVDYYYQKAQKEDPFYDDFERLHNNAVEIMHTAKKPCRKREHGKPDCLRASRYIKKLRESLDDDFDSVEKLSWITNMEDSYYVDGDDY